MSAVFLALIILSGIVGSVAALRSGSENVSDLNAADFTILEHE